MDEERRVYLEGFSGWGEPYYSEVAQIQALWGERACTGGKGQGAPCGHGQSSWGKGGKLGRDKGNGKGKGQSKGKSQSHRQCYHCGEWGRYQNWSPRKSCRMKDLTRKGLGQVRPLQEIIC